jgi:hypothetical protein
LHPSPNIIRIMKSQMGQAEYIQPCMGQVRDACNILTVNCQG